MDTKKLRQKILDLAIHGKLVPQDSNDEPASVLLERIRAEKERLIKEGKIKRSRKTTKTSDDACDKQEVPFKVPSGWVWTSLYDITSIIGDGLHGTPQYNSQGFYYFINGNNLFNRKIVFKKDTKRLSRSEYEKYKKNLNDRTILVSINGTIGNIGTYNGEKVVLGKSACYFNLYSHILKDFICYLIESNYFLKYALDSATGSTIKNVPLKAMNNFKIPLPPLAEQQRIVEEIERWFKLIDIIEQGKADLQSTIKQAKNKILDLAIHGKLVPQDPNDEPTSELLKRINPKAEITCDNGHYPKLPKGWAMCTLSNVCKIYSGFAFSSNDYRTEGIPLIRISNIKNNTIDLSECVFIKSTIDDKFIISRGDLLIAMSGATTGKMGIYENDNIAYLNQRVGNIKVLSDRLLLSEYRNLYMLSKVDDILKIAYGGAQPNISASAIENLNIMLPPRSEQKRIVSKIEDLFGFINTIEESL
jgi:putative type I restriction enzyme ecoAI specificity protein